MKIFITGDFCPINRADIDTLDLGKLYDDSIMEIINQADIRITNLECPLTNHSKPINKTGPALKASKENIKLLTKGGFNVVTLANNHIMDYGSNGFKDTIKLLNKYKIEYVGAGLNKNDTSIIYKRKDDFHLGIINVCENEWSTVNHNGYSANGFSEIKMFYAIREAKKKVDKLIVIHHGGHEMYNLPSPRLKKTLRFFVDCGADAVINHHTHCIGGSETYKQSPIFYSLGNFIFDDPKQKKSIWNYGMAVTLEFTRKDTSFECHYFEQFNAEPKINLVNESKLNYDLKELNHVISNDSLLEESFDEFVNKKKKLYKSYLEPIKSRYILALINRGLFPSIWNIRKRYYLKNLITCESHREMINKILENETSNS